MILFVEFKPLNVQFVIENKEEADALRDVADALGDKVGDRRLRGAAAAKALIEAVLKRPELAEELLGIELPDHGALDVPIPKGQTRRQGRK